MKEFQIANKRMYFSVRTNFKIIDIEVIKNVKINGFSFFVRFIIHRFEFLCESINNDLNENFNKHENINRSNKTH